MNTDVRQQLDQLLEALRPFAMLGGPDDGIMPAFQDMEDDEVVYKNSGRSITAGDVRAARKLVSKYAQPAALSASAEAPGRDDGDRLCYWVTPAEVKKFLTLAGIAAPESMEELGFRIPEYTALALKGLAELYAPKSPSGAEEMRERAAQVCKDMVQALIECHMSLDRETGAAVWDDDFYEAQAMALTEAAAAIRQLQQEG